MKINKYLGKEEFKLFLDSIHVKFIYPKMIANEVIGDTKSIIYKTGYGLGTRRQEYNYPVKNIRKLSLVLNGQKNSLHSYSMYNGVDISNTILANNCRVQKKIGFDGNSNILLNTDKQLYDIEIFNKYLSELIESNESKVFETLKEAFDDSANIKTHYQVCHCELFTDIDAFESIDLVMIQLLQLMFRQFSCFNVTFGEKHRSGVLCIKVDFGDGIVLTCYVKQKNRVRIEVRFNKKFLMSIYQQDNFKINELFLFLTHKANTIISKVFESKDPLICFSSKMAKQEIVGICSGSSGEEIFRRLMINNGQLRVKARDEPGIYKNTLKLRKHNILEKKRNSTYRLTSDYQKALWPSYTGNKLAKVARLEAKRSIRKIKENNNGI